MTGQARGDARVPFERVSWGVIGALTAGTFAVWMLFFPDSIAERFAWAVEPRYAQLFIGAGYIFRTAFFLNAARERNWIRLRWIVWGNFLFTGALLFATYWHAAEFNWNPFQTPVAHFWVIFYVFEPLVMIYLIPRGTFGAVAPVSGGPLVRGFKPFLVLVSGLLFINGLLLMVNPEFAATRWPWELNPLDSRIVSAWFLGWAGWTATMAFATDWDEIRTAVLLFLLNGVALIATAAIGRDLFLPGRATGIPYLIALALFSLAAAAFFVVQERRRPRSATPEPADERQAGEASPA
jgi:hypothetical protein